MGQLSVPDQGLGSTLSKPRGELSCTPPIRLLNAALNRRQNQLSSSHALRPAHQYPGLILQLHSAAQSGMRPTPSNIATCKKLGQIYCSLTPRAGSHESQGHGQILLCWEGKVHGLLFLMLQLVKDRNSSRIFMSSSLDYLRW